MAVKRVRVARDVTIIVIVLAFLVGSSIMTYYSLRSESFASRVRMRAIGKGFRNCRCASGKWPDSPAEALKWVPENELFDYGDDGDIPVRVVARSNNRVTLDFELLTGLGRTHVADTIDLVLEPCSGIDRQSFRRR